MGAALLAVGAVVSLAPAAHAADAVTYSSTVTLPAPPSSNFSGASGGGDGWAVAFTSDQLFNVFHHQTNLRINCHNQSDASACWAAPKTVTDGSGNDFATGMHPAMEVDQSSGHLYVQATRSSDDTGGVVCIDTTLAVDATDLFCGFTALTGVGDSPISSYSALSNPVLIGTKWYMFNDTPGPVTGTRDTVLCFDLATGAACAGQPFAVGLGSSDPSDTGFGYPIAATGTRVMIQYDNSDGFQLTCFDATTKATCSGSWPQTISTVNGAPFPLLNSSGTATGVCLPIGSDPCFDFTGATVATPTGLAAAVPSNSVLNGPAVTINSRVYVPNGSDYVSCYDYSSSAQCDNFPLAFDNLSLLYTVNADPQRPSCLWVNADSGSEQIQNFDAYTGSGCGDAPIRVFASSFVAANDVCVPSSWTTLKVTSPDPSEYTSGAVDFETANGDAIPGVSTHALDGNGATDLTDLHLSTQYALPQFVVTFTGATGSFGTIHVKLTWSGTYDPSCVQGGTKVPNADPPAAPGGVHATGGDGSATVGWTAPGDDGHSPITGYEVTAYDANGHVAGTCTASAGARSCTVTGLANGGYYTFRVVATNAIGTSGPAAGNGFAGTSQTAPGYWLGASDGGVFTFGHVGFYGSMHGRHLNAAAVGLASTPSSRGYWVVAADGGVFSFGDAGFHGSMLNRHIAAEIVGIAATPSGNGYWLAAKDAGVFAFGDAAFYGSRVGQPMHAPVSGIASTADGHGYWLLGADGAVYAYGDAVSHGSMMSTALDGPAVGIAATPSGHGYWIAARDGGVFAFGDAKFFGSSARSAHPPTVGIAATSEGSGYWLVQSDGSVAGFGAAPAYGSMAGKAIEAPMVSIAA